MRNRAFAVVMSALLLVSNLGGTAYGQELIDQKVERTAEESLAEEDTTDESEVLSETKESDELLEEPKILTEESEELPEEENQDDMSVELNRSGTVQEELFETEDVASEQVVKNTNEDGHTANFSYGDTLTLKGNITEAKDIDPIMINSIGEIKDIEVTLRIKCLIPEFDKGAGIVEAVRTAYHKKEISDTQKDFCVEELYETRDYVLKYNEYVDITIPWKLYKGENLISLEAGIPYVEGDGIKGEYEVILKDKSKYVTAISLAKTASVRPGKNRTILKGQTPEKGISRIEWSSDNTAVASVNKSGLVTGISNGTAIITGTLQNGNKYQTTITVEDPKLSTEKVYVTEKENKHIKVTGNVSDVKFLSGDNAIATVDQNGRITGKRKGSTVIYAYVGRFTLVSKVVVETPQILQPNGLKLEAGSYTKLTLNGTKQKIKWSSSNKKVAVVDNNGVVYGIGKGKVSIIAKVGKYLYQRYIYVGSANLKNSYIKLEAGDTRTIKTKGTPTNVKWSSKNSSVAKVDSKGRVTGKKAGTTKITAKIDGKNYYCTIKVTTPELNIKSITLDKGETQKLSVIGTKKKVIYSTNASKVATVDKNGTIKAKNTGSAVITVKAGNKKLTCKVKVREQKPSYTVMMENAEILDGYITVNVKNTGSKTLRFYSKGARWEDDSHNCYSHDLELYEGDKKTGKTINSVDIKPGKTVKLKMRLAGSWDMFNCDFKDKYTEFKYTFKYDNKNYNGVSSELYGTEYVKQ